jgi:hypothetical protein
MAISNEELYDKAMSLSGDVEDNFLDLGKALRQLLDRDPDAFQKVWQKSNLGRRKAYYLVEVSRIYDPLPIARSRLKKIGWTKLAIIGKQIDKGNAQELLQLAEENTTKQLEALMKGEKPVDNAHCVLMYFTPKQYKVLEEALVQNGGTRSGRGIVNKEEALLKALKKAKEPTSQNA